MAPPNTYRNSSTNMIGWMLEKKSLGDPRM